MRDPGGLKPVVLEPIPKRKTGPAPHVDTPTPPVLQAHGFTGSIQSWNDRVQKVYDAYHKKQGKPPSPGLVFDVARAPVADHHIPLLFDVPTDPRRAVMQAAAKAESLSGKTRSIRPDGMRDPDNHYKSWVPSLAHPASEYATYKDFFQAHNSRYAMTPLGFIPGLKGLPRPADYIDVWKAAAATTDPRLVGKYGKLSLDDAEKIVKAAKLQGSSLVDKFNPSTVDSGSGPYARNVLTIAEVQNRLQSVNPQKFAGLPVTGYMTPNWIRAYSSWSRSEDFGLQSVTEIATQNHFEPTLKGVAEMNKAYRLKLKLLNDPKNVGVYQILQSVPLRVISDMNWSGGVPHNPVKLMKNIWGYMDENTSNNPVIGGLQDAFHAVGLGFNLAGGLYNQVKSDALAMSSIMVQSIDASMHGRNLTRDETVKLVSEKLKENPTWAKIVSGGLLTDKNEPEWARILDQASNVIVDVALGIKFANVKFNAIPMGDVGRANRSIAIFSSSKLAHNAIKSGDLRQAVRDLHGGSTAERLVTAVEKKVQSGEMSHAEFKGHVIDLYSNMETKVGEQTVRGHLLSDYASPAMRNMGASGFAARSAIRRVNRMGDAIERSVLAQRGSGVLSPVASAELFIRGARQLFANAKPAGAKEIFGDRFPHDLNNFLVTHGVASRDEARLIVNSFIRARAGGNVSRMDAILNKVHDKFTEKYPLQEGQREPSVFEPQLETEQLSRFNFPSKTARGKKLEGTPESLDAVKTAADSFGVPSPAAQFAQEAALAGKRMIHEPFQASMDLASAVNSMLNKINHVWRTIILTKNVGRFWKHAARDPLAAVGGGYRPWMSEEVRTSAAEARNYMDEHPALFRRFSTSRGRSAMSEMHWLSNDYWVDGRNTWNMKGFYSKAVSGPERAIRVKGAAQYVRKMLSSDAYEAFLHSSPADMEPLVDLILKNPGIKAAFFKKLAVEKSIRGKMQASEVHQKQGSLLAPTGDVEDVTHVNLDKGKVTKSKRAVLAPSDDFFEDGPSAKGVTAQATTLEEAHRYAAMLFKRFQALHNAAEQAGTNLDDMWRVLHQDPGLADEALMKHLSRYQVPVEVHDGTMVLQRKWDAKAEQIIKLWMSPNFWSRGKLFDHSFDTMYHGLRQSGADEATAIEVASHVAERVTMKHMLDFSNQLEFEQRFRWLFPFLTKHRLFVQWLGSINRQYPLLALPVTDVGKMLDDNGNVKFGIDGIPVKVNMLRLFWLNTEDQPATIPAFRLIPGGEELSGGSWWGGTGTAFHAVVKLATGAHTYQEALAGMNEASQRQLDKLMINRGIWYRDRHPGMPVPEGEVVKWALQHFAFRQFTNDTMYSPVTFQPAGLAPKLQKLHDQYTELFDKDPGKAAEFLDQHPEVGLSFGQYKNPKVFWHVQDMFDKLHQILANRDELEAPVFERFKRHGELDQNDLQALRKIGADYGVAYRALLVQDAEQWQEKDVAGFPPGKIEKGADGKPHVVSAGPFGLGSDLSSMSQNMEDWLHKVAPKIPEKELLKVWGEDQKVQQEFLDRVSSKWITDPDTLRKVKAALNTSLAPYRDMPKDPGGQLTHAYFDARAEWFKSYAALKLQLKTTSGSAKEEIQDKIRALDAKSLIDSSFTYNGKTYNGPAFALTTYYDQKTAPERLNWFLTNLVNAKYESLSSTDKIILGLKNASPEFDAAWIAYRIKARAYKDGQLKDYQGPVSGYKQFYAGMINKAFPGFMKDWLNTQKPKYQLVSQYKPLQQSRYYDDWSKLLKIADIVYIKNRSASAQNIATYWRYQVVPSLVEAAKSMPQGFQDELTAAGGPKFLSSLMETGR